MVFELFLKRFKVTVSSLHDVKGIQTEVLLVFKYQVPPSHLQGRGFVLVYKRKDHHAACNLLYRCLS